MRANKLFQLLDFCAGGAVEINRRVGAAARGTARAAFDAIRRVAGRNIVLNGKERRNKMNERSWGRWRVDRVRCRPDVKSSSLGEARTCISKRELVPNG